MSKNLWVVYYLTSVICLAPAINVSDESSYASDIKVTVTVTVLNISIIIWKFVLH